MSKRIVIVGGGYIGASLAKLLDGKADVTLIEPRSHFVHTPAMIRAVVEPSILASALMPLDNLLKHGQIVRERAQSVDADGVILEGGARISADYVVVATGSNNAMPFKPNEKGVEGLRADNARIHNMLKEAQTIAIVGAGAVGTELAGEIAHFMPNKKVTLISANTSLFAEKPAKFGAKLQAKLQAAGVELIMGQRVENLQSLKDPYAGSITLSNGESREVDLVFPVIGSHAVSTLLENLPGANKGHANRIKTDPWLRPSNLPNVFAAGDVADIGDDMTIVATSRQLPWLSKTLLALVEGKSVQDIKPYTPWDKSPILVPLGPVQGNSYMVAFTAGNFLTRQMKGKGLFISKYAKLLGVN